LAFTLQPQKLELQKLIEQYDRDGYLILEKFFDEDTCNKAIKESEDYILEQKIDKTKIARAMNMHQHSPTIKAMFNNKELWDVTKNILKAEPFFLQTIYFHKGSEQALHSDYVYMSTIPDMQLCGLWIGLEDTNEENGALRYVPGSHKIPITNIEETYKVEMPKIKKILETEKSRLISWAGAFGVTKHPNPLAPHDPIYDLMRVYNGRPDLQSIYPEAENAIDYSRLCTWADWHVTNAGAGANPLLVPHGAFYASQCP